MKRNEKKFHTELVKLTEGMGGWGYKTQRQFVKGTPDIELKMPLLPLCKIEIKHEVYKKATCDVAIRLTELQRKRLRNMQKVGIACGWAVFATFGKTTWVYFSPDPDTTHIFTGSNSVKALQWVGNSKAFVITEILATLTRGVSR